MIFGFNNTISPTKIVHFNENRNENENYFCKSLISTNKR